MKRFLIVIMLVFTMLSLAGAQTVNQEAAKEINEGARQYRAGNFIEAQRHFEKALEIDPSQKNAPLFIARSIHAQYKPGNDAPENRAKAEAAIEAYRKVLEVNPGDDNSFAAVAMFYRQLREEDKEREWLMQRASSELASTEKRSDAYTVLASKEWNCSYEITEKKENKQTMQKPDAVIIEYKKPRDISDFYKAQQCGARGMELIEQAINLNVNNPSAWSYKTNLLREMAKLAQMENNAEEKARYDREADEAEAVQAKLNEEVARKKAEEEARENQPALSSCRELLAGAAKVGPEGNLTDTSSLSLKPKIVSGGVLNGKAISKPQPAYPAEAKEARASGTVTVQIVIDESGDVLSARAVGGHPLLQPAAVNAACQSRFSPTRLSGQPVKVSGVVTYNFVLQ